MSLRLSCYQLFSPPVRERQQILFTENSDDHGKEENAARYSGRLSGRQLPSHPGLKCFPAEQKLAVKRQLGKHYRASDHSSFSWCFRAQWSNPIGSASDLPQLSIGVIVSIDPQIIASTKDSISQRS